MWRIKQIFDGDYGCEEVKSGEEPKLSVTLISDDGTEKYVQATDKWLMERGTFFTVMALGLPNAISTLLSGFANSFANQLLSKYGSDFIAANAAAGRVNMIITMILMGICMGAQPLIAYNYGAGNVKKMSGVIRDPQVASLSESILSILMISSPFLGFFYLGTNFLQATGEEMKATVISDALNGPKYSFKFWQYINAEKSGAGKCFL